MFSTYGEAMHTSSSRLVGAHFCLGAGLARIESEIALRLLCERFPDLRLVADQSLSFPATVTLRGARELWVEWCPAYAPLPCS
jgi:cytochrome P450